MRADAKTRGASKLIPTATFNARRRSSWRSRGTTVIIYIYIYMYTHNTYIHIYIYIYTLQELLAQQGYYWSLVRRQVLLPIIYIYIYVLYYTTLCVL